MSLVHKKKVFICSSSEARQDLLLVSSWLEASGADPIPWDGGIPPGKTVISHLLEESREVDGAVLIFTADDKVRSRGKTMDQPRDNLLIEYGVFASSLGLTSAVVCKRGKLKEITDIQGHVFIDLGREASARAELDAWVRRLPNRNEFASPRVAMHCSETEEIRDNPLLQEALNQFYATFVDELFNLRININICGTEPFRSAIAEHCCERIVCSDRGREYLEEHAERIRWYWHSGSFVPPPPPLFKTIETKNSRDRTWAEVDDADLVVAVCGKTRTAQQIETVLGSPNSLAGHRSPPVIIVGWFGGQLYEILQSKLTTQQEKRIIRKSGRLDFTKLLPDWHNDPTKLARELARAISQVVNSTMK